MKKLEKLFCAFVRRIYLGCLISVRMAMFWHKFGRIVTGSESPLLPDTDEFNFSTCNIKDSAIRNALSSTKLTRWSLDIDSINWLTDFIRENKCCRILEFGSGTSSVVFANLVKSRECGTPQVVSLEQDESYAEQSRELIEKNGFDESVMVIHCPLGEREHTLGRITGYDVTEDTFKVLPDSWRADMLFVDGPATDGWGRLPAIEDSMNYLAPGCFLVMDDALRDDELKIAEYLSKSDDWEFMGIAAVSKGIAVARRK